MANTETVYYDMQTDTAYRADGTEISNGNGPELRARFIKTLNIQLLKSSSKDSNDQFDDKYTEFSGMSVTASAAVDDNSIHYYDGLSNATITAGAPITTIAIKSLGGTPRIAGRLKLTNATAQTETINYNGFSLANSIYTFTLANATYVTGAQTPTYSYAANDAVRVLEIPIVKDESVDCTDKATGLFVAELDCDNVVYVDEIEGETEIDNCKFELTIFGATGERIEAKQFEIQCLALLDDDGGVAPAPDTSYYTKAQTDVLLESKASTVPTATENNFASFDADGDIKDSTKKASDFEAANANIQSHISSTSNPHSVTASQAGAVATSGNETVAGVKTFSSFPVTPSSAPSTDYQVANKKYVDDNAGGVSTFLALTDTPAAYTGQAGKYAKVNGDENALEFDTPAGGGDVIGPATNTDNAIARFDGTDSKTIQNSLVTIDDSGTVNIPSGQSYKINGTALAYGDVGAAAASHNHTLSAITDAGTAAAATTGTSNGNVPTRPADNSLSADAISEITGSAGVTIDGVKALDSFLELTEVAAPAAGAANTMRVYAKDDSGTTKLCVKDSAGTETILGAGGGGSIDNTSRGDGTAWTSSSNGISAAKLEEALNEVSVRPADRASLLESGDNGLLLKAYYDSVDSFNNADIDAFSAYLKAIWNLTETSGNRADSIGSNTLVDNGSVGYTESGINGNAADLNGTSQFFSLADNADISPTTGFAFSMWVNPDAWNSATSRFLFEKENAAQDERDYALAWWNDRSAGKLTFMLQQSNGTNCEFDMAGAVSTGSWQHILAVAYDGTMKIFINGVADSNTQSYDGTIRDSAHSLYIGCRTGNSHYYDGKIARMGFWKNISGSWTSIANAAAALYNSGAGTFYGTNVTQDFRLSAVKDSALITTAADQFDSLSEKTSLADNDMFLIEDSADGNAKKYVKKSNLGAGGSGDVVGPASATDGNFASFDETTGKLIKDSGSKAADFATASHNHDATYAKLESAIGKNYITNPTFSVNQIADNTVGIADAGYFADIWKYRKVGAVVQDCTHAVLSGSVITSFSEATQDNAYTLYNSTNTSRAGECFTLSNSHTIRSVKFYLKKTGSPTGTIGAYLYAASGTPGTDAVITGSVLASATLDCSTFTTDYVLYEFVFTTPYTVAPGNYGIQVSMASSTSDASNYVSLGLDASSPSYSTGNAYLYNGSYTAESSKDVCFYLYGIDSSRLPTPATGETQASDAVFFTVTTADSSIAAGDLCIIQGGIEGKNFAALAGRECTLSFRVRGAKTGTHCVAFQNAAQTASYVAEYTISSANTWETKSVTLTFNDTASVWTFDNTNGLIVAFCMSSGSDFQTTADAWQAGNYNATSNQVNETDTATNVFAITNVKLEIGATATPFVSEGYLLDSARVKRYLRTMFGRGGSTTTNPFSYRVAAKSGNTYAYIFTYEEMRTAPTSSLVGTWASTGTATGAVYIGASLPTKAQIYATANADGEIVITSEGTNPYALLNARLF